MDREPRSRNAVRRGSGTRSSRSTRSIPLDHLYPGHHRHEVRAREDETLCRVPDPTGNEISLLCGELGDHTTGIRRIADVEAERAVEHVVDLKVSVRWPW